MEAVTVRCMIIACYAASLYSMPDRDAMGYSSSKVCVLTLANLDSLCGCAG